MTGSWIVSIPEPGKIRIGWSEGGHEDLPLAEATDLVGALLKRGRVDAARAVAACWFVSLAQAAGLDNVTLGP